jgi:hypothetical protein
MRRSWIKIETNTPDKPEICIIASHLRMDADAVMGKLIRVWSWAELNVSNHNETSVTIEFLDKVAGKKGFSGALEKAGWLQKKEGSLVFPGFDRHNGQAAKGRAQTALRVSKHRKRRSEAAANEVDESVEIESSRDEKGLSIKLDNEAAKNVKYIDKALIDNALKSDLISFDDADFVTPVVALVSALDANLSAPHIVTSETQTENISQLSVAEGEVVIERLSRTAKRDKLAGQPLLF